MQLNKKKYASIFTPHLSDPRIVLPSNIIDFSTHDGKWKFRNKPWDQVIAKYYPLKVRRKTNRGCRGRDRMVVGFTTTYAISTYHH